LVDLAPSARAERAALGARRLSAFQRGRAARFTATAQQTCFPS
jgi:hypothetical protein